MRQAGYDAWIQNPYEILNKIPKCNISFGRIKGRQQANIKVVLKKQCVGPYVTALDTKQYQPQNAITWTLWTRHSKPWTRNNTVNWTKKTKVEYKAYHYLTAVYTAIYTRVMIPSQNNYCLYWNKSNKMQQLRLFFAMALLYMFRVTIPPIIRSTYAVYGLR